MPNERPWETPKPTTEGNLARIFPGGFNPSLYMHRERAATQADFLAAMHSAGLVTDHIVPDGGIHRVKDGQERDGKSGWYVFFQDAEFSAGAFGSWKGDWKQTWCSVEQAELEPEQRQKLDRQMQLARERREQARREEVEAARKRVQFLLGKARTADESHPYLKAKGIQGFGALETDAAKLLIPVMDSQGVIHGAQFIHTDGTKRFQTGTTKKGHFFPIGVPSDRIWICEGYATAASIHEATGQMAIVAFDCGNLRPVGESIRKAYPHAKITFAADNDHGSQDNPGITKAQAAATKLGADIVYPDPIDGRQATDWNDYHQANGIQALASALDLDSQLAIYSASTAEGRAIPPVEWALQGWVPKGEVTLLYAVGGAGKSFLMMDLMIHTALGLPFMGIQTSQGGALGYFCEEDRNELDRRVQRIMKKEGLNKRWKELNNMMLWPRAGENNILMTFDREGIGSETQALRDLRDQVDKHRPELVVVDTAADVFAGNENDRNQVNQFVKRALFSIAKDFDCAVLLNAHPSKTGSADGGSKDSGSTAWHNSCRSRMFLGRDEDSGMLILEHLKSNRGQTQDPIAMFWQDDVLLPMVDSSGAINSMVERRENAELDALILERIGFLWENEINVSTNPKGNYAAKEIIRWLRSKPDTKSKKITLAKVEDCINRMIDDGQIKISKRGHNKSHGQTLYVPDAHGNKPVTCPEIPPKETEKEAEK